MTPPAARPRARPARHLTRTPPEQGAPAAQARTQTTVCSARDDGAATESLKSLAGTTWRNLASSSVPSLASFLTPPPRPVGRRTTTKSAGVRSVYFRHETGQSSPAQPRKGSKPPSSPLFGRNPIEPGSPLCTDAGERENRPRGTPARPPATVRVESSRIRQGRGTKPARGCRTRRPPGGRHAGGGCNPPHPTPVPRSS